MRSSFVRFMFFSVISLNQARNQGPLKGPEMAKGEQLFTFCNFGAVVALWVSKYRSPPRLSRISQKYTQDYLLTRISGAFVTFKHRMYPEADPKNPEDRLCRLMGSRLHEISVEKRSFELGLHIVFRCETAK